MGLAAQKPSQGDRAPFSRAPSSGVRPRVRPANDIDVDESVARLDAAPPVVVPRDDHDDELHLEDAVPLQTDAALAVVLGFVMVAASGLVVAFSVL